eukprot:5711665-Pleurochrysis_carterae.AAC.2
MSTPFTSSSAPTERELSAPAGTSQNPSHLHDVERVSVPNASMGPDQGSDESLYILGYAQKRLVWNINLKNFASF